MKVYTVIDVWEESFDRRGCWMANFSDVGEARKCFFDHLHFHEPDIDDDTIGFGFTDCLTGSGFAYDGENGNGTLFVRTEEVKDKFNQGEMPWA